MNTIIASGQLTKTLTQLQLEFDRILEDLGDVLQDIESSKEFLINSVVAVVSPNLPLDKRQYAEDIMSETIDQSVQEIVQAKNWIGRLNNITRNGLDISEKVERSWLDVLKEHLYESKWFRERFPLEYEKRQREKEYQRYRLRPETFYGKPSKDTRETYRVRPDMLEPDIEKASKIPTLQRRAQSMEQVQQILNQYAAVVEQVLQHLLQLIQSYFSDDSPILNLSNALVSQIKSKRSHQINPTLKEALSDEIQALEALFGSEEHPGKYITSGSRAFLIPAMRSLQNAVQRLYEPTKQLEEIETTTKEVGEVAKQIEQQEKKKREWFENYLREMNKPRPPRKYYVFNPGPERPLLLETQKDRKKFLLERQGIAANRQKRYQILQRIASSR